jgi:L-fuculose-phosphate aldolase
MSDVTTITETIVSAMHRLEATGLNRASSGNCSVRDGNTFWITPSGVPTAELRANTIVPVGLDGQPLSHDPNSTTARPLAPSSEWRFHRDLYAHRPELEAVVHTHSPFATSLACLHREIPAFHYMIAVAGGNTIRCAPYALFGTQELSDHALTAMQNRKACLLANHGMIAAGSSLDDAMRVAIEVESLCEQYWRALQIGAPHILSEAQMAEVMEKFKTYGPRHDT